MNLRKRIERLERKMVTPEDFEEVWDRMWARTSLLVLKWEIDREPVVTDLSPEDQALLAGDSDELRRADQALWEKLRPDFGIPRLFAVDGALTVPLAVRIQRYEAEEEDRKEHQSAEIREAMASLDRGLGIEHHHVEAWVVSLNSDLERLVEAVE